MKLLEFPRLATSGAGKAYAEDGVSLPENQVQARIEESGYSESQICYKDC